MTDTGNLSGTGIGTEHAWSTDEAGAAQEELVRATNPVQPRDEDAVDEVDDVAPPAQDAAHDPALDLTHDAAPVAPTTRVHPLLTAEVQSEFLQRWSAIQISFVEDPRQSVQAADSLVQEIATTLASALQERRSALAAQWREDSDDTEQLRLALRQYRVFIGDILPR